MIESREGKTRLTGINLCQNASISISSRLVRSFFFLSFQSHSVGSVVLWGRQEEEEEEKYPGSPCSNLTSLHTSVILSSFPFSMASDNVRCCHGWSRKDRKCRKSGKRAKGRSSLFYYLTNLHSCMRYAIIWPNGYSHQLVTTYSLLPAWLRTIQQIDLSSLVFLLPFFLFPVSPQLPFLFFILMLR